MTMPATLPGTDGQYLVCVSSPAPQTGTGPGWTNETGFDSSPGDYVGAVATWSASALPSKGLICTPEAPFAVIDTDRYAVGVLIYTINLLASAVLPDGSLLRIEFGVYAGGTFTALGDPIEMDISPTGSDISGNFTIENTEDVSVLGFTTFGTVTHARITVVPAGAFTGTVTLDACAISVYYLPRVEWQPKYADVFDSPAKAANMLRRLAGGAGHVLVMPVTDSTGNHRGFGWEEGYQHALQATGMDVPKWSTGLAMQGDSAASPNNSSLGTGEQFSTVTAQDFLSSPARPEWAAVAGIRPFSRQTVTYSGSAGNFKLKHNGYTDAAGTHTGAAISTADIAHNASASTIAAAVQTAIGGLVSGTGGPLGTAPVTLEFYGATWAPLTLDLMTVQAPGSGSAITPTIAQVEYSLATGFPTGVRTTVAGNAISTAHSLKPSDRDLVIAPDWDIDLPLGISISDAVTHHHVYLADGSTGSSRANSRKGADANEAQIVTIDAGSGTFTVTPPGGVATAAQAYDVSAANLQAALRTAMSGSTTINVYGAYSYRVFGYYVEMAVDAAGAAELLLNPILLTPGVCDYGNDRETALRWNVWHSGTGGTFKLSFNGNVTGNIAYNADASTVQTALSAAGIVATVTRYVRTNFYVYWSDGAAKSLLAVGGGGLSGAGARAARSAVKRFNNGGAAYAEYATTNLNSNPASSQAVEATLALSASTRYATLDSQWASAGANTTAPFLHLAQWTEKPAVSAGYGLHLLIGKGGRGLRKMAESARLVNATFAAAVYGTWYANAVARSLDGKVDVIVPIHSGVNDLNDSTNSIGSSPAAGNTRAGITDNLAALIAALRVILTAAGVPATRQWFMCIPSLPVDPTNTTLDFVRLGMQDYSATDKYAVTVRTPELCRDFPEAHRGYVTSTDPYTDTGATANDRNHHLRGWYRKTATRLLTAGFAAVEAYPAGSSRNFRTRIPRGARV